MGIESLYHQYIDEYSIQMINVLNRFIFEEHYALGFEMFSNDLHIYHLFPLQVKDKNKRKSLFEYLVEAKNLYVSSLYSGLSISVLSKEF